MASFRLIGGCEFDATSGELRRDGTLMRLEPQPAAVLALLVTRAGKLVTHEELRHAVWGEATHVNFRDSVHYCIRQIRAALDDRAQQPRFIDTIPRRGYRFRADAISANHQETTVPRRRLAIACVVVALGAVSAVAETRPNNHHDIAVALLKTVHDFVF